MDVATTVREHLANEVIPALPDGVGITIWNDESQDYEERADILLKNGILGLLLVLIALSLCSRNPAGNMGRCRPRRFGYRHPSGYAGTRRRDQRPKLCSRLSSPSVLSSTMLSS